jgi:hypothetical protein
MFFLSKINILPQYGETIGLIVEFYKKSVEILSIAAILIIGVEKGLFSLITNSLCFI